MVHFSMLWCQAAADLADANRIDGHTRIQVKVAEHKDTGKDPSFHASEIKILCLSVQ